MAPYASDYLRYIRKPCTFVVYSVNSFSELSSNRSLPECGCKTPMPPLLNISDVAYERSLILPLIRLTSVQTYSRMHKRRTLRAVVRLRIYSRRDFFFLLSEIVSKSVKESGRDGDGISSASFTVLVDGRYILA